MWPVLAIVALGLGIWLRWIHKNRRMLNMAKQLPGPPALPIIGNAFLFMVEPLEFVRVIKDLMTKYGGVFRAWLGPDLNIIVSNPDDVKILLTSNKTTVKGPQYKYMAHFLGGGILTGSGTPWRKHRKIAAPNYGKRAIKSYVNIFNSEVDLLIKKFMETPKGQQIDINKYIVQTTTYTVCQTLIGLSREEMLELPHLQTIIDETPELYDLIFDRMRKWYLQLNPVFWLTKLYKQHKKFMKIIREFSMTIVKHRMEKLNSIDEKKKQLLNAGEDSINSTQFSVIDRFILSQELDPTELLNETFTIFTTSQEALAKISSLTLLMMAFHPKCQEKLHAEIVSVIGNKDRPVTYEDIKQMPYLDMVFKEVIRLFPIAGMMQRTITEDIAISTCTIPAGASLLVPTYHLHRSPKYWPNPDVFDPERFSPENTKTRNPYCYVPFSLGSMDCLGRHYAEKLVKTIVIRIMQNFKLSTLNKYEDLRVIIVISTTIMDGFQAIVTPR
ncbi:cytochrome P450 4C1-like isoform X2 [Maniola jurtina]|uniref:cytochrome P450 4C1-like isoform X1 n=2 Tax=Maniola jurtina TaxID=191418 RepID=UPI001E68FCC5|nr:cytochrome P450 4C1-like isoform X1 [Maniola jurtina]XP_045770499.1 cytochrome P450 4C1-like isoform X1 [Maniola jurtina]XP_045770500.1 cytochrome P450 4C1-like isoform X2 [Maniola jurtina]